MKTVWVNTEQLREELLALLEGRYGTEHAVRQKVRIMRRSQVVAMLSKEWDGSGPMMRGSYPNAPLYYLDYGLGYVREEPWGIMPVYVWRLVVDGTVTAMPHESVMLNEEWSSYEEFAQLDRLIGDPNP